MPHTKKYDLTDSPLFRLSSRKKLCDLLRTSMLKISNLLKSSNYKIWTDRSTKRKRRITAPKPILKGIQKRLQILLSRIETPSYLYSGVKGISHIDNARVHLRHGYVLNLDIQRFYDNCSKNRVFQLFHYTFEMPADIAWILADLVTLEDSLPAGSPCSQLVAFFAYQQTFDAIDCFAHRHGLLFTLFVDDMTFSSSSPVAKMTPQLVRKELEKADHTINEKKTKWFSSGCFKVVTGAALSPQGDLKVRNRHREAIIRDFGKHGQLGKRDPAEIRSLMGRLQAARQIEPQIFQNIYDEILKSFQQQKDGAAL